MLSIEQRAFWGGLGILALGLAADSAEHLAGWEAAEMPTHWSLLVGMVVAMTGVFLRALAPTIGREASHAHR